MPAKTGMRATLSMFLPAALAAGLTAKDDTLPKRMLEVPCPSGTAKGKVNELDKMLPEYYEARGWTKDGVPTNETVARLGL